MSFKSILVLACCFTISNTAQPSNITLPPEPSGGWDQIDSRPLPSWYDEAKIGIFIHWGLYSVPSFTSEWFWIDWKGNPSPNKKLQDKINQYMSKNYKPDFAYQDFANEFTADFFNATEWADLIKRAGARYVVFTSKHHEGYAMWPSAYSNNWNSVDTGPHKDIVGELSAAIRKTSGIRFGLYHSLYEWFHPLYLKDKANGFSTQEFVNNKIYPEMVELVNTYKPEILWSDGEFEAPSSYWKSTTFLSWLYNNSPVSKTVVTNDRWGRETLCKHGGFYTCSDRYNPGTLQTHKWENAMTLDKNTWGFNRPSRLEDYLTSKQLIDTLSQTIACGGNLLVNVGPTKDGIISPIFQDRLVTLGKWLDINGEAVYGSKPWDLCQNDTYTSNVWYTTSSKGSTVYAFFSQWPDNGTLILACPKLTKASTVTLIGLKDNLQATTNEKYLLLINLPDRAKVRSNLAWVVKMTKTSSP